MSGLVVQILQSLSSGGNCIKVAINVQFMCMCDKRRSIFEIADTVFISFSSLVLPIGQQHFATSFPVAFFEVGL